MKTQQSQQQVLETARRALAILEQQAAGFTSLTIPSHLKIGLEDKLKEIAELEGALRSAVQPSDYPKPEQSPCPYRGLEPFEVEHAKFYFGREKMVKRLVVCQASFSL